MSDLAVRDQQAGLGETSAGDLCLRFANTVSWHASPQPEEGLNSFADLVRWSVREGALADSAGERLLLLAADRPDQGEPILARAIELREAIYRIFRDVAAGDRPPDGDLETLNFELEQALHHLRVAPSDGGFDWKWKIEGEDASEMLWRIARSAAQMLVEGDLARVRHCADDRCGWLFMDMSKNRSRRWCDMNDCGNRAKARRFYARKRASHSHSS